MTSKINIFYIYITTVLITMFSAMFNITVADNGKIEISQSMIPLSITTPGSYIFTETVTGLFGANGITILTNSVAIDLNGFSLLGVENSLNGIEAVSNSINIKVTNGIVSNWGQDGINMPNSKNCIFKSIITSYNSRDGLNAGFGARVIDSKFINNGPIPHNSSISYGIGVEVEQNSTVTRCIASGNNQHGITAHSGSTITDCSMLNNNHDGIHGSHSITVNRCTAISNDEGLEVDAGSIIIDSTASHNFEDGIRIKRTGNGGGVVKGCVAFANGLDGIDVDASSTVMGCNSYSNTKHGIRVEQKSQVINSISSYNGSSGIKLGGSDCRAENNTVMNNDDGIITENSTDSIIIKNISDHYDIESGNHFEVISPTTPNLPDNPWINIVL